MENLLEEGYRLCTCKKTHKSGVDIYNENQIFYYKDNDKCFVVKRLTIDPLLVWNGREYTYLPGDFHRHFVDTIEQRNKKIDEILSD